MKANRIFNNGQKAKFKRQNSKVNFKNQFQKSKGRDNLTTMLYSNKAKRIYRFFFYDLYVKPSQFPNIHLTKKPRTSYVTIGKNQCNPWQKNLAAFGRPAGRQAGKNQKSISKVKRQGQPNYYALLQ